MSEFNTGSTQELTEEMKLDELENDEAEELGETDEDEADKPRIGARVFSFLRSLMVVLFILGFFGACLWKSYSLEQEKKELHATEESLEQQIEEEKAKVLDYKVDKAYYSSDRYKEEMARNRFRLLYPGEIMISVVEK